MATARSRRPPFPASATLALIATPGGLELHLANVPPADVAAAAEWLERAYAAHLARRPVPAFPDVVPGGAAVEVRDEGGARRKRPPGFAASC